METFLKSRKRKASTELRDQTNVVQDDEQENETLEQHVKVTFQEITKEKKLESDCFSWIYFRKENLKCDHCEFYTKREADMLYSACEQSLCYNTGELAKVHVFGKWHEIPRKQVAHGDAGLTYTFSGKTLPAVPWTPLLENVRNHISETTGEMFNFVLINRYNDGDDHIGEHRDDERDLDPTAPIASLSLGATRDFILRHTDARKGPHKVNVRNNKITNRDIANHSIPLRHGELLLMWPPTNKYWYHSIPKRKTCIAPRISMTFRRMLPEKCKHVPTK